MSGMFDLHVGMALRDGWAAFAGDAQGFKALFKDTPDGTYMIQEAVLDEWHAALAPGGATDGVSFREAWAPDQPTLPQVVVQLMDEPHETQPLGFFGQFTDAGDDSLEHFIYETALISLFVSHPELLRALYVVVRAIMVNALPWFTAVGYSGLSYAGGGDMRPAWEPMPEGLGVLFRQQRWRVLSKPHVTSPTLLVNTPWFVAASDATVDGYPGGVDPIIP